METIHICMCSNLECQNTLIFQSDTIKDPSPICDFCKSYMHWVDIGRPSSSEAGSAEMELRNRGKNLNWLNSKGLNRWPGPIAFEYVKLKDIIYEGNIEGGCWKLANLVEVVVSYFYAASLELGLKAYREQFPTLGVKISKIKEHFRDKPFNDLLNAVNEVVKWRNNYGVGHGSLASDKEFYINSLLELCQSLNNHFASLSQTLTQYNLGLWDGDGNDITGYDYIYKLDAKEWKKQLYCRKDHKGAGSGGPIYQFGHYFSCPDVFFLDQDAGQTYQYKNFRTNSRKYLNHREEFCWKKDFTQVAWLNSAERADWLEYFKSAAGKDSEEFRRHCEALVDAVTQFQSRGMHSEANQCKDVFEKYQHLIEKGDPLHVKMALVNYCRHASLGKRQKAKKQLEKIQELLKELPAENRTLKLKAALDIGFYEGVSEDLDYGIEVCKKGISDAQEIKKMYALSAAIDELELRKNMIYLYSRKNNEHDTRGLKKQCLDLFFLSSRLYNKNWENRRVIDILGYVCNLYGDFCVQSGESIHEVERDRMKELNRIGLKVRKKIYEMFPDHICSIRGYAWSIHCKGRLAFNLNKNVEEARRLIFEAEKIRLKGEKAYPDDLIIKEDLFETYLELIRILPPGEDVGKYVKLCQQRLEEIERKENDSPRVLMLKEKLKSLMEKRRAEKENLVPV